MILPAVLVTAAVASGGALPSEPMPGPAAGYRFTVQTATCGDLYEMRQDAAPGEGKDPVIRKKRRTCCCISWSGRTDT
jgi:hypothetical protein